MPFLFDPDASKVSNAFGGFDSNEKGIFQYPKKPLDKFEVVSSKLKQLSSSTFLHQGVPKERDELSPSPSQAKELFEEARALDPIGRHFRLFIQDPDQIKKEKADELKDAETRSEAEEEEAGKDPETPSCITQKHALIENEDIYQLIKKPIDPVHWEANLFDSKYEKHYLRNTLIEDPYRSFLKDSAVATTPPHYFTEYKASFSGNPTKTVSSSGRIYGLSRPTDITEPCDYRRNRTQKLRDVVFSHEKEPVDSHLDYKDPKRYNPWPRLKMSYDQMLEGNYRPRPSSGVEYNVTTLLPAVSPHSKLWIV